MGIATAVQIMLNSVCIINLKFKLKIVYLFFILFLKLLILNIEGFIDS